MEYFNANFRIRNSSHDLVYDAASDGGWLQVRPHDGSNRLKSANSPGLLTADPPAPANLRYRHREVNAFRLDLAGSPNPTDSHHSADIPQVEVFGRMPANYTSSEALRHCRWSDGRPHG